MQKEIIEHEEHLPSTIDELIDFVIVGNEAIKSFKAKLKATTKAKVVEEARKIALRDGRRISRLVYDAMDRLGELLSKLPRQPEPSSKGRFGGRKKILPDGINWKQSFNAQEWHKNREIINQTFEKKIKDIPTIHDGIKAIQKHKTKKRKEEKTKIGKDIILKDIDFRLGDFKKVLDDIPDNSIDLILTDPPYPNEYLHLYGELSEFASKKLKPSGFCISYAGHIHLPEVIQHLGSHLQYYWIFCLYLTGKTQIVKGRNVVARWKPILFYQKPPFKRIKETVNDYIINDNREKELHDWQQGENATLKFIEYFSKHGDIICDPFVGSGTTLYCAKKLKRNCIGAEINEDTYNLAKTRLKG